MRTSKTCTIPCSLLGFKVCPFRSMSLRSAYGAAFQGSDAAQLLFSARWFQYRTLCTTNKCCSSIPKWRFADDSTWTMRSVYSRARWFITIHKIGVFEDHVFIPSASDYSAQKKKCGIKFADSFLLPLFWGFVFEEIEFKDRKSMDEDEESLYTVMLHFRCKLTLEQSGRND